MKMKLPYVNPGDQVIRDRRNKDIAKDEGRWSFPSWPDDEAREIVHLKIHSEAGRADHEGGRRDHREGVYEGTRTRHPEEIMLQGNYALSIPCISNLAKEESEVAPKSRMLQMVARVPLDASHVSICVTSRREKVSRYIRVSNELLRYAHV